MRARNASPSTPRRMTGEPSGSGGAAATRSRPVRSRTRTRARTVRAVEPFIHQYQPAAAPGAKLTLLMLHGTGGNEHDLLPLGRHIAPRAALLSPRGQVLERG